ncbi:MAG: phage tail tape measure protein, partial [Candidatus Poribacteria bacterium]|nr:phage tail tape measure protein [Candidatus Poribacteria bacterium]
MDRALRNVTSLMAGAGASQAEIEKQYRTFRRQLASMSVKYGVDDVDLAKGLYNVVSATFEGPDAKRVLDVAAKGAAATLTPLNDMTSAVTKSLHAFRNEGESISAVAAKAGYVMDQMFMTLNRGMFTMPEFVKAWEAIPSMLKAVGVSLEEGMAMYSTLSRRGLNVEEIETGVRAMLLSFAKMEEGQKKAAETLFGEDWQKKWSPDALANKGILGVMKDLEKLLPDITYADWGMAEMLDEEQGVGAGAEYLTNKFGEMMTALTDLFPNIRALKAVLALAGPGLEMFAEDLEMMGVNAVGATDRAMDEMAKSTEYQLDRLKRVWGRFGQGFGNLVLPVLGNMAEAISDWYGDLPMMYASETGMLQELVRSGVAPEQIDETVAKEWDKLSPFDQLFFMIKHGWQDFTDRVNTWLEHEGGRDTILGWGVTFGKIVAEALTGWTLGDINTGPLGGAIDAVGGALRAAWDSFWTEVDWDSAKDALTNPIVLALLGFTGVKAATKFGPGILKTISTLGIWGLLKAAVTANTVAVTANTAALTGGGAAVGATAAGAASRAGAGAAAGAAGTAGAGFAGTQAAAGAAGGAASAGRPGGGMPGGPGDGT